MQLQMIRLPYGSVLNLIFFGSRTHLRETLIAGSGWHLLNLDFGKFLDLSADISNL